MSNLKRRLGAAVLATAAACAMAAPNAFAGDDAPPISTDSGVISYVDAPVVGRIAGPDRVATAIKGMCSRTWGSGQVIIASSDNFADALASGPLADVYDAPILVTPNGSSVDPRVLDVLTKGCDNGNVKKGEVTHVTLTSGTGVLTDGVVKQLEKAGLKVQRFAGANRYQTSATIAYEIAWMHDEGYRNNMDVFFADGLNFPDALAAGAAAAQHNGVVLLTMGAAGLDESTFKFASNAAWSGYYATSHRQIWAVGGNASKAMKPGFLGQPVEPSNVVVGADRYATAAQLAGQVFDKPKDAVVASGTIYADAVFAGGYAANLDAPLLLTDPNSLSGPTSDYLKAEAKNELGRVIVFGGTGSVSPAVQGQIVTAITKL